MYVPSREYKAELRIFRWRGWSPSWASHDALQRQPERKRLRMYKQKPSARITKVNSPQEEPRGPDNTFAMPASEQGALHPPLGPG